ncbi:MAG: PAS domain S-box protein [bacterium]
MRFMHDFSIQKKLTLIILLISGVAVFLACLGFIIFDLISFKDAMVHDLHILAEIIGTNSTAAISFDRADEATEMLAALVAKENITTACIYSRDGVHFASYARKDIGEKVTLPPVQNPRSFFENRRLNLFHEIILDGEQIGTLYIQSDLEEFYMRLKRYAAIIALVLGLSALTAFIMAANLQRIISEPILHLAKMAKKVSLKKDFSIRAKKFNEDELGYLTERFNEMLSHIQERDTALQLAHHKLECQAEKLQQELDVRKKVEKALRHSEERFRDLFDNAPDMYIILDPEGTIVDFNQRGLKELGYTTAEVIGKPIQQLMYHRDRPQTEKYFYQIQTTGQPPKNIESRLIHKSGRTVWVSKEFSLLKSESGKLQTIRVICRDITERKRLQEELERAQRLEAAGRIAGQIAHDFNNLLGPLAAYPTLIREDLPEEHPVVEMVDEMEIAARKIADINQQLLALGRRGHYTMDAIDLNELVQNVVCTMDWSKKIALHKSLEKELFTIKGGAAQLTRAITNLLINAIEAIHNHGTIAIQTSNEYLDWPLHGYQTVKRGEYVKLAISDTGHGIKPELLDKIFDPFFTTKTMDRMRGSGLGLSVVHGIIEDHKGYITVESEVGSGTTFCLYFPVSREIQEDVAKTVENISGGNESILVVDDDPIQRRVTTQLLKRLGYRIHTVQSGEQAVEFVKENPQDLLILDMVMDGIDGAETYKRILKIQPKQRAIVLSGYAKSKRVKNALRIGAGEFVAKPISLNALAAAVRKELDKNIPEYASHKC